MSNTSNLVLPFLAVGQAQKHVTVNESLRKLDALVQLSVVSATTTAEPASPGDGEVWIVPPGKSGTNWSAYANWSLGYYRDGAWVQVTPREGWLAYVKDSGLLLHYAGSAWSLFAVAKAITVSATDKVLGRISSGAGAAEEITFTDQAQALCDDTSFSAMRTTLGVGGGDTPNFAKLTLGVLDYGNGGATKSVEFLAGGFGAPGAFNTASNGDKLVLYRNGSGAYDGAIGVGSASNLWFKSCDASGSGTSKFEWYFGNAPSLAMTLTGAGHLEPGGDNTQNLGSGSKRWATVYAGTGTINTSDAREKTAMRGFTPAERRAIRRLMASTGVYQWLSSIAAKGADPAAGGARLHVGVTAQAVQDAFAAEGLDATSYGLFCIDELVEQQQQQEQAQALARGPTEIAERTKHDEKGAPVVRFGVRYDQIFAMALAVLFTPES